MIDLNKLNMEVTDLQGERNIQCRMRLLLTLENQVSKYCVPWDLVKKDVEENLRRRLWHDIYGDFYKPVMELISILMKSEAYRPQGEDFLKAETLIAKLYTLLDPNGRLFVSPYASKLPVKGADCLHENYSVSVHDKNTPWETKVKICQDCHCYWVMPKNLSEWFTRVV